MLFHQGLFALSVAYLPLSWCFPQGKGDFITGLPGVHEPPAPPETLDLWAPALDTRFQPALDFDKDSCYNVPAMGPAPNNGLAVGLEIDGEMKLTAGCRKAQMLGRGNVYSRQRCNNGYCVIMYAYYFQKDATALWAGKVTEGHKHDWEHVVVWVRMEDQFVTHVAVSQHKTYEIKPNHEIHWVPERKWAVFEDGSFKGRPAIVYHKHSILTHAFRFGTPEDSGNGGPENHKHEWIYGPLIGHFGWDTPEQRDRMYTRGGEYWGAASVALTDNKFGGNLEKARPKNKDGGNEFEFDVNNDDKGTNRIRQLDDCDMFGGPPNCQNMGRTNGKFDPNA